MQVDAIQQGTRKPPEVLPALTLGAHAVLEGAAGAPAGIGGGDQLNARGEHGASRGAGHDDGAFLERLAQGLQRAAGKLGELVEEEDAEMPQAHLARMGHPAASDEARLRHGMMRRPERTKSDEALAGAE